MSNMDKIPAKGCEKVCLNYGKEGCPLEFDDDGWIHCDMLDLPTPLPAKTKEE